MNSLKAWIERGPMRAVAVIAVIALLGGAVIGLGVGYKIEHDRTASDVRKLKKAAGTNTNKPAKVGSTRVSGSVTTVTAAAITLKTKSGADRTVNVSSTTAFETASKAAKSDAVKGRHVFVIAPGSEVMILPEGSTLGREITDVAADSFSLAAANGLPAGKVKISASTVFEIVKAGSKADVKTGAQVLALGTAVKGGPVAATEVITLPAGSKF